jgi:hypothetical protein
MRVKLFAKVYLSDTLGLVNVGMSIELLALRHVSEGVANVRKPELYGRAIQD